MCAVGGGEVSTTGVPSFATSRAAETVPAAAARAHIQSKCVSNARPPAGVRYRLALQGTPPNIVSRASQRRPTARCRCCTWLSSSEKPALKPAFRTPSPSVLSAPPHLPVQSSPSA
eukprot:4866540-Prymnesium_polylepis.2